MGRERRRRHGRRGPRHLWHRGSRGAVFAVRALCHQVAGADRRHGGQVRRGRPHRAADRQYLRLARPRELRGRLTRGARQGRAAPPLAERPRSARAPGFPRPSRRPK